MTDSTQRPIAPRAAPRAHSVSAAAGVRTDEYYWLRDDARKDPDVIAYLEAENAYTRAMLAHAATLEQRLYDEIVGRIKQDDASVPWRRRGYWYYSRYEEGREYPIHARKAGSLAAAEEVLIDVNELARGFEFFQVAALEVSPDNALLAYAEDNVGRRQWTLRFRDIASGVPFPDRIANAEPGIAWAADSRTVFYVEKDAETLLGCRVKKHVLGTDPAQDPIVYEEEDDSFYLDVGTTKVRATLPSPLMTTTSSVRRRTRRPPRTSPMSVKSGSPAPAGTAASAPATTSSRTMAIGRRWRCSVARMGGPPGAVRR